MKPEFDRTSMHDPKERRRHPRSEIAIPVELHLSTSDAPMRTAIQEISLSGCYFETMFTFEVGTKLRLVLSLDQERVSTEGIVVTKYPQVGNGIDFVGMRPEDRAKLTDFLSKCASEE